jgi:Asp-tRNA(Asn)/Glu-tRNA(Gln) amidotransferase A subunit family amidase
MPTGVTLIGRAGQDAQLLAHAFAFEQATKLRVPPPVTT